MEHRRLGDSGLKVSVVGVGCNQFGSRCDADLTAKIVNAALDQGVTLFDTADIYSMGKSEECLGQALRGRRHEAIVATKFGYQMGTSRSHVIAAAEASLKRLGTDYIDLYQIHRPDPETPIEETLRALEDLVRRGDVRYIGCSNFNGWQVVEAAWTAKTGHTSPFISAQNDYSLLNRAIEPELAPACLKYGLGFIPFFPLAGGLLTGKYRQGEPAPEGVRLAPGGWMTSRIMTDRNWAIVAKLESIAKERGHTLLELAMSWLACQPFVSSVIAGATSPEQVEANVQSVEWQMTDDDLAEIDAATK